MSDPVRGVAILVWSADPENAGTVVTPFVIAQAAAAMDLQVEMYFTARSVTLLACGNADTVVGFGADCTTLSEHVRRTRAAGVELRACGQALRAAGLGPVDLVPECAGAGSAV